MADETISTATQEHTSLVSRPGLRCRLKGDLNTTSKREVDVKATQAAIYARVSTRDKQETMNQLTQLRELCRRQGWLVVSEYIDRETGSVSTRAEFQKMLLHASQRKFDVLLFWALDRLTREGTLATLQYLERLTSAAGGL